MDKSKDINTDISAPEKAQDGLLRIETYRSGIFQFQIGVDIPRLRPLLQRVEDAHQRFSSVPILPDVATALEKEVLVSSIYGTNTIESGTLTEAETAQILSDPGKAKEEKDRRVVNIGEAYEIAEGFGKYWAETLKSEQRPHLLLHEKMFTDLHRKITRDLSHLDNVPGRYRDNPKQRRTQVGDSDHGGIYTPPKCLEDIQTLMQTFIEWVNSEPVYGLPPLIRAPLIHYYFERIHPFWDGNGRVGRVAEAMTLKAASYQYAPFALSHYYLEHIDRYFSGFTAARKAEGGNEPYPNTVFVEFFLEGMLTVLNRLHDRVNQIIGILLYKSALRDFYERKVINARQYTVVSNLLHKGTTHSLAEVQTQPWYVTLYMKLTPKTRARDMKRLEDIKLLSVEKGGSIVLLVP